MKKKERHLFVKFLFLIICLIVITILGFCSLKIFQQKEKIVSWEEVEETDEYTYIEVSKMSEAFASYDNDKKEIHFVIEKEDTGLWHTYLIAIDKKETEKFRQIIDYSYEKTTEVPKPIKVYGYPVIMDDHLKEIAIKNIKNFVPSENEIEITKENFDTYLTNSFLDTTIKRKDKFDFILFVLLLTLAIMILLFLFTIFDRFRLLDQVEEKLEEVEKKQNRKR